MKPYLLLESLLRVSWHEGRWTSLNVSQKNFGVEPERGFKISDPVRRILRQWEWEELGKHHGCVLVLCYNGTARPLKRRHEKASSDRNGSQGEADFILGLLSGSCKLTLDSQKLTNITLFPQTSKEMSRCVKKKAFHQRWKKLRIVKVSGAMFTPSPLLMNIWARKVSDKVIVGP